MNVEPLIRPAVPADLDALIELLNLLFTLEADFTPDIAKQRRGLQLMLARPEERCVMVAEHDGAVLGMCTAQLRVSTAEGGMVALIEDMVLREEWRGRGIGRTLLGAVESWALTHGAKRLELLADRENHPALAFYDRLRWRRTQLICLHKK
ncbi:ribosomal protein S18 acetylase RimI-like enzyme [Hydrogenispora ethanolica]|jgi:GNAT superfamily N-acetyltransferase|uniref:Ribosomal protein S18 acetylase RimI-like enzyme n=1 Tax=Hydrogenispora ethanolica TaxID=1082276 RepID=A0A4V6NH20_HYDET|nr:GNAT family N-acetyltransferase [Hydrogenispora ethanolica]TCL71657.1 ribosomal protein S18 acetylase RimI-like enzyme [Hydrogenispora ethanolica]